MRKQLQLRFCLHSSIQQLQTIPQVNQVSDRTTSTVCLVWTRQLWWQCIVSGPHWILRSAFIRLEHNLFDNEPFQSFGRPRMLDPRSRLDLLLFFVNSWMTLKQLCLLFGIVESSALFNLWDVETVCSQTETKPVRGTFVNSFSSSHCTIAQSDIHAQTCRVRQSETGKRVGYARTAGYFYAIKKLTSDRVKIYCIIECIVLLLNYRTYFVGYNQIKSVFDRHFAPFLRPVCVTTTTCGVFPFILLWSFIYKRFER